MKLRPKKSHTVAEATKLLEKYCAYQERCHRDVIEKLKDLKMIPQARDKIIAHLITNDYLNETRFSKQFVRGKFHQKKWGRIRLVNELRKRNISKINISIALKEIDETEYQLLFDELAEKRFSALSSEKNRMVKMKKMTDYLLYRGWEYDMINQKLNEWFK